MLYFDLYIWLKLLGIEPTYNISMKYTVQYNYRKTKKSGAPLQAFEENQLFSKFIAVIL